MLLTDGPQRLIHRYGRHAGTPLMTNPFVIAIDGPAAAGKGTLARRLAGTLGFAYLDTGLLYRALARKAIERRVELNDAGGIATLAASIGDQDMTDPDLRSDATAKAASQIAALPEVRSALLDFQRTFCRRPPGAAGGSVLDGRDIGTVVAADADVKLFVTASFDVRVARRLNELRERGLEAIHTAVVQEMLERDTRDSTRTVAPLEPAPDAIVIDTSSLDPEAVFGVALDAVAAAGGARPQR